MWAIAVGGFQFQVFAAVLERRFDGPTVRVARHHPLRLHRDSGRQEGLVAMGSCTIMDVAPTDVHKVFPHAVAVPRARDDLDRSRGAPYHATVRLVRSLVFATTS